MPNLQLLMGDRRPFRGTALADERWRDPANWRLRPAEGDNFWT